MNPSGPAISLQSQLWDEGLWDELLAYLDEGRVIPIVGATWVVEGQGQRTTLEGFVAERLAARFGLASDDGAGSLSLNGVVSRYLQQGRRREALYPTIRAIVQEAAFVPPQALMHLASITDFNLFVTTCFDSLLETAINQVRFNGEPRTHSIAYRRDKMQDIEVGKADLVRPTVYHLFGKLAASPIYSISDDDLLEYLFALQAENRPARLFDELQNNHLLVLGGNFSDWLARLFLRMTKRRRLSDPREVLEILADDRSRQDRDLVFFLSNFSPRTKIFNGDAAAFTEELWRRWQQRHPPTPQLEQQRDWAPPNDMTDGAVFISYARQDAAAVQAIAYGLRTAGIDSWFDLNRDEGRGLQAGDKFDLKIQSSIRRCSLFVAVLSRHTETRLEGYFRREWQYAIDRSLEMAERVPFIIPVIVDDTERFNTLPARLDAIHRVQLLGGTMSPEFVGQLRSQLRSR
jgi:TIR domain/SIR2-like domain